MLGTFENQEACINELKNQNFVYYTMNGLNLIYVNKYTKEMAEVHVYSDNSASALYGEFNNI